MTYLEIAGALLVWAVVVVLILSLFWINEKVDEE